MTEDERVRRLVAYADHPNDAAAARSLGITTFAFRAWRDAQRIPEKRTWGQTTEQRRSAGVKLELLRNHVRMAADEIAAGMEDLEAAYKRLTTAARVTIEAATEEPR